MPVSVGDIEMMLWKFVFKYQLGRVARREPREFFRLLMQCLKCAGSSKADRAVDSHNRKIPAPCQDQGSAFRVELVGNSFLSQNKKQFKAFCFFYIRTKPPQNLSNPESEACTSHRTKWPLWICLFQGQIPISSSSCRATHHCRAAFPLQQ